MNELGHPHTVTSAKDTAVPEGIGSAFCRLRLLVSLRVPAWLKTTPLAPAGTVNPLQLPGFQLKSTSEGAVDVAVTVSVTRSPTTNTLSRLAPG